MPRQQPRKLDAQETFNRLVSWLQNKIQDDNIPGIVVGVSGTDSILVFLACYQAFKNFGRPESVLAINFVHKGEKDEKNWFARDVWPCLKKVAPDAQFELNDTIEFSDDPKRWGEIFSRAIRGLAAEQDLGGNYKYVAGTRNRTEKALGSYSLISKNPSLQPIGHLYKTEVLQICGYLGVPQIALDKSREIDCACGRYDVQAHYLDELDYAVMVKEGELSADYMKQLPSEIVEKVEMFYARERVNNEFREEIPLKPDLNLIVLAGQGVEAALQSVLDGQTDEKLISYLTPSIVEDKNIGAASDLLTAISGDFQSWRAEAYTLLGVAAGRNDFQKGMLAKIFGQAVCGLDDSTLMRLAHASARIGQYAFSFPSKRFTTQGFNGGASLIERGGFERQERSTDLRDARLPKFDPQRDEFGTGFIWQNRDLYIEQRRAYLLLSDRSPENQVTILIRNSSHFFGRDRLAEPAYFSFNAKTPQQLLALTRADIENARQFRPWHSIKLDRQIEDRLGRVETALNTLDEVDLKFSQWLKSRDVSKFKQGHAALNPIFNGGGGLVHLREFLQSALIRHVQNELPGAPLHLAQTRKGAAPWKPLHSAPVTPDVIAQLKAYQNGESLSDRNLKQIFRPRIGDDRQLVMLSSAFGDYPARLDI